ncbi:hypothetical protein Tco_0291138 [Tanacetum coccineum]
MKQGGSFSSHVSATPLRENGNKINFTTSSGTWFSLRVQVFGVALPSVSNNWPFGRLQRSRPPLVYDHEKDSWTRILLLDEIENFSRDWEDAN